MTNLVCLAKVIAAHGIKGELKVKSFTADPKDVCNYGMLTNKEKNRYFELKYTGFQKGLIRVKIKGIETRNDAEALVGLDLYVSRDKLPKLEKDTFYQTDLVGLDVLDLKTSKKIGKIVGIYNFGAGDILEIKFEEQKQTEMLPFNNEYVPEVDVQNGFVLIAYTTMNYQKDEEKNEG